MTGDRISQTRMEKILLANWFLHHHGNITGEASDGDNVINLIIFSTSIIFRVQSDHSKFFSFTLFHIDFSYFKVGGNCRCYSV